MLIFVLSKPVATAWHDISDFPKIYPPILAIVIAAIAAPVIVPRLFFRPRSGRGPVYSFPRRVGERDILQALGKVTPLQIAILKFIVDGYLEGVDPAEVARHFHIRPRDAVKSLRVLHRLGLLYIKRNAGGAALFYLIESVMAKIGEPRFFDLIGLGGLV